MLNPNTPQGDSHHPSTEPVPPVLLCFSHLRWDFVYQRPQHLMSRFAGQQSVYYVEEPVFDGRSAGYELSTRPDGVNVVVPHLPHDLPFGERDGVLRALVDDLLEAEEISGYIAWYYTPMALSWTRHLRPAAVVYDCMDELSLFRGAPREMVERESELLALADVVFTGGTSLYEAKRARCDNAHCFPSSVDAEHFRQARSSRSEPADQQDIAHPRLGFAGVIDERMDIALLDELAAARPSWQLVMLGPVVKIDPAQLPQRANIHYLGAKPYAELPAYMGSWDVALMPFALNESTKYISPTKTPEYLAAGLPVVSTPIRDVVSPYGVAELARIASTAAEFIEAVDAQLAAGPEARGAWLTRVDGFLSTISWDRTQHGMASIIARAAADKALARQARTEAKSTRPVRRPSRLGHALEA